MSTVIFNFMKPFSKPLPDKSLVVVNGHDDGELGRVHGLRIMAVAGAFLDRRTGTAGWAGGDFLIPPTRSAATA